MYKTQQSWMLLHTLSSGFQSKNSLDRGCLNPESGGVYMYSRAREPCALIQGALTVISLQLT